MKLDLRAPHQPYFGADGTKLPGVTTITGMIDKPPLRTWTGEEERDGILRFMGNDAWTAATLKAVLPTYVTKAGVNKPLLFADVKRDRAADLGTITHARCHANDVNDTLDPEGLPADLYEQSQHGLDRWVAWVREQGLTLVACEKQVVHESTAMRYGGTLDRLFADNAGRKVLVDIKTSKRSQWWPYDETYAQVAAYANAAGAVDRIIVARVGKEPGDELQAVELTSEQRWAGWDLFCHAYGVYQTKRALDKARTRTGTK